MLFFINNLFVYYFDNLFIISVSFTLKMELSESSIVF